MDTIQANIRISDSLMPAKNIKHNIPHNIPRNMPRNIPHNKKIINKSEQERVFDLDNDNDTSNASSIRQSHNINYPNSKINQLNNELKMGIYYHISKDLRKLY